MYRYVRVNKLDDCESERSLGIEASFYKKIEVHDSKKILGNKIHKQTLTNKNYQSYSRKRAIVQTKSAFGFNAPEALIEKALFLSDTNHAILAASQDDRKSLINRVEAIGRDFPESVTTQMGVLVTNKDQMSNAIDTILANDTYYQVPLNLTHLAANTNIFTEDWLIRVRNYIICTAFFLFGYTYWMGQ